MAPTLSDGTRLTIGLMSGTSLDGIDGVLLSQSANAPPQVRQSFHLEMPVALRSVFLELNQAGHNELHRGALAANWLAQCQATVVRHLLQASGQKPHHIQALGSHGQTVRHMPAPHVDPTQSPGRPTPADATIGGTPWPVYTLQLNNPALLAELTGITVVADFRSRDVAAGGQGAPLVPAFHAALFGQASPVAVVNIGGMANATLLQPGLPPRGFDTGPGNVLLDAWCMRHLGQTYDADGQWAAGGVPIAPLLAQFLAEPYFALHGPRSTGRELFNLPWLDNHLQHHPTARPQDVQATLLQLTAVSIQRALPKGVAEVIVCGGGALNRALMRALQSHCAPADIVTSDARGIPVMDVEAAAFAWLADRTLQGLPGNAVEVTGAAGPRVLGAIYPA